MERAIKNTFRFSDQALGAQILLLRDDPTSWQASQTASGGHGYWMCPLPALLLRQIFRQNKLRARGYVLRRAGLKD